MNPMHIWRGDKDFPACFDDPRCYTFVGAAVGIGAAVLGTGASIFAATSASNSAAQTNATNAANVNSTNQLNYQEFLQSRGSDGSAIYPIYAQGAEQNLYDSTNAVYDATGALQPTAAQLQTIAAGAAPGAAGATTAAGNIFNGTTLSNELTNQAPVSQANIDLANTQKSSSLLALQSTLNNIKAIQAGKGYSGDSFGNSLLRFNATQQANQAGAGALATAKLTNAQQTQGIQENAINRELQNLNAPSTTATQQTNLAELPANAIENLQVNRQNLFSNFKIGTGSFQYQNLPLVNPTASTGQIVGQGISSLASGIGTAASNASLTNAINGLNPANTPGGVPTGNASFDPAGTPYAYVPPGESIAALGDSGGYNL